MPRPSAFEFQMVEWINRLRLDPGGEFDRLIANAATSTARDPGVTAALRFFDVDMAKLRAELSALTPVAPLAWNDKLHAAAWGHSILMRDREVQSHQLPGEASLGARVAAAGYAYQTVGENVFAYTRNAEHGHAGMVIDWGAGTSDGMQTGRGHRMVLMDARLEEIGVSVVTDGGSSVVGPYVATQNLGMRLNAGPFLAGAVFRDRDGDDFYDMGEAMANVRVAVSGRGAQLSGRAGDYGLEVGEGMARVVFSGPGVPTLVRARVEVGRENVKLDLLDGRDLLATASLTLETAARSVSALGTRDVTFGGTSALDRLFGGPGDDVLIGAGGPDRLFGGDGADALHGGAGADRLEGGAGSDELYGGWGADRLLGGAGADRLAPGPGWDNLWGGSGADVFVFGPNDGRNVIHDWEDGDRIAFDGPGRVWIGGAGGDARLRLGDTVVIVVDAAVQISHADLDV